MEATGCWEPYLGSNPPSLPPPPPPFLAVPCPLLNNSGCEVLPLQGLGSDPGLPQGALTLPARGIPPSCLAC